jgi:hypothetical protein
VVGRRRLESRVGDMQKGIPGMDSRLETSECCGTFRIRGPIFSAEIVTVNSADLWTPHQEKRS